MSSAMPPQTWISDLLYTMGRGSQSQTEQDINKVRPRISGLCGLRRHPQCVCGADGQETKEQGLHRFRTWCKVHTVYAQFFLKNRIRDCIFQIYSFTPPFQAGSA